MKIYVASSWRNPGQPVVVDVLRQAGHEVYDFRHPTPQDNGFHWSEIDPNWRNWEPEAYIEGLKHPLADDGFGKDMCGLNWSEATVLVLPCGRSAHLEAGYAAGQGKPVIILLDVGFEPELMYKMAWRCVTDLRELIETIASLEGVG